MDNKDIKHFIKRKGLFRYEVANGMGISESQLSKMFRKPLTDEEKERIIQTVHKLTENN